jgi:hypothetical protein
MTAFSHPSLVLIGLLALPNLALSAPDDKDASKNQKVEGVIVKAEPIGSDNARRVRLTLNTAAVWRDYARDTALDNARGESTRDAAKKGDDSVATEGQPRDKDTLVTIEVRADTPAHKRFRAEMDAATLGSSSVEAAKKAVENPSKESPSRGGPSVKLADLRKGLYVAVGYEKASKSNRADWLIILVPVRDDDSGR